MAKTWSDYKREKGYDSKEDIIEKARPNIYTTRPTYNMSGEDKRTSLSSLTSKVKKQEEPLKSVRKTTWSDIKNEMGYREPPKEPVNEWKENPLKSFGSNAVAGFGDLGRAGANIVDMTLDDKNIPFIDNYLANIKADTQAEDERLNKINSSSKYGEIYGGVSRGIGQAGTSVAMGVAGAPLAGANPLLTAGGTQLVGNAATLANPTNLMTAQRVITDMAKNPNFVPSMVQGVGSQYEQAINKGASREQAFNAALIGGVPSGLIEMSGGLETLSAKLANKTKGLFGQALQNALEEGFEEIIQYPIENAGQKTAYDKNMPFFSTKQDAIINPGEMAKAGFIGGAVGGIMGGGAEVINNRVNKSYQKNLNTQYETIISRLPEESATLQKVNELKKNNVNIDDDVKRFVVEQGKRDLGIDTEFQSETDNVLRNIEPINQTMQSENKPIEQIFNSNQNIVKTQNNALQSNQELHIENVNNPSEVKAKMYNYLQNNVISTSEISKPIVNTDSGLKVEVSRATINQTLGKDKAYIESKDKQIKLAALADIETLISNGKINIVDNSNVASSKTTYATLTAPVTFKGETQNVTMDIRRTDKGNKYFVHSIKTAESKTSGVIDNNVSSTINQQAYTALDKLGQATGIKIKIVESIDSPDGTRKDIANGQFVGDTLEISKSSDNPLLEVAKHEITHALQVQSPKLYEEYKTYVIDSMKQNDSTEYENAFNNIKDLHRLNGIKISDSAIEDEIVADATDRFLTDENSIKELAKNNPKLGQKILDIIREFIKTVQDSVQGVSRILNTEQLNKAEQLWVNALNDAIENKKVVEVQKEAAIAKNSLKDANKKEIENGTYLYHGTSEGAFRQIRKNGLIPPGNAKDSKYVFFSNNEKYSKTYADRKGGARGGRILRVMKTDDIILDTDRNSTKANTDYRTLSKIDPANIEVKIGNNWVNVQDYYDEDFGIEKLNIRFSLKDSKGNTLTKEQQEFFKDSKVKDKDGNLLVVYHGTNTEFTKFNASKGELGMGVYFTDNIREAGAYSHAGHRSLSDMGKGNPRIQDAFLNISNPFIIKKDEYKKYADIDIADTLKEEGVYNGIIATRWDDSIHVIAFNPNQIKATTNQSPTSDEDIRFSLKEIKDKYREYTDYLEVYETKNKISLDNIEVKKENRNKGIGNKFMNELVKYADRENKTVILTPTTKYKTQNKLISWYKTFGFVENKGKNTNFDYRDTMYRKPTENEDIRFSLKNRLKGDALLDAEDLIEEIKSNGGEVNENGYVTVYHATSKINADEILKTKKMKAEEDGLFFSTKSDGQINGYGNTIIKMSIPVEKLILDDVFGDEAHLRIPLRSKNQILDVKDYIVDDKEVKFQLKNNNKDIERLRAANERLKEQFKLTKGVKLDERAIKRASKAILKEYSSKYNAVELDGRISNLYGLIANDEIDFDEMTEETQSIARDILENVKVLDDEMYRKYTELRQTLRNTPIMINDRYENDFRAVGTFAEFKRKNRGRINIVKENGVDVDKFYQELSDRYPDLFIKDIANPADQLMTIEEVLDSLIPVYENPYNADMNTAVEMLGVELFENFTNIPEAKRTFADEKKDMLNKLRKDKNDKITIVELESKDRIKEILANEKTKRDIEIKELKDKRDLQAYEAWWRKTLKMKETRSYYQDMVKELRTKKNDKIEETASRYKERIGNIYEDRHIREIKASIQRKVKRLDKMLRKPTTKQHIPKVYNKTIAELLSLLDFSTDRQKENTVLKLRDLRAEYEKIAKSTDETGIQADADPYIMEALEMLNGKRIVDLNLEELTALKNIVAHLEFNVKTFNKTFFHGQWVDIVEKSNYILAEMETDDPKTESAYSFVQGFKNMLQYGMVTPQMFFEKMGNTFNGFYGDFRDALDAKITNTKTTQDYMSKLLKDVKKEAKTWTGDKAEIKKFRLQNGTSIELTPGQIMSLYMLNKREQAQGHIYGLGIKSAPIVTIDKNGIKHMKQSFTPNKVTMVDVAEITNTLTSEQKKVAEGMGEFMNTISKQWVNATTLKLYGYELAKEQNYFPIKTDSDFLKSEFDNVNLDPSFATMGFLKNTLKGAGNAIVIQDIFDVFTEHADKSSTYNAFMPPVESIKKVINYKTQDSSVKQAMNKKYGFEAFKYLKKFMVDLQGGLRTENAPAMLNTLMRNTKRALLGLNVRSMVQQPTAIIRASAMIDLKYLAKGTATKGNQEEMFEYSPIAMWKSWGYFNLDTGRTMKDIILDNTPLLDKQYLPLQIADNAAWAKLWNAVKFEIEDRYPTLNKGTKEYFDAVNVRFSDIVDRTQVVDTVMHRADIMRQSDSWWKVETAFMSEPIKTYNLLVSSFEKYHNDKTEANRKEVVRTTSAWMATMAVNTLIISLVDMWRKDEDDEETLVKKWRNNAINDVLGMIPFIREITNLLDGYSIKRMEYNGIEKIAKVVLRTKKFLDESIAGEKHNYPMRLIIKDWINSVAYTFGVSTLNVERELKAIMKNYVEATDNKEVEDIYNFLFKK